MNYRKTILGTLGALALATPLAAQETPTYEVGDRIPAIDTTIVTNYATIDFKLTDEVIVADDTTAVTKCLQAEFWIDIDRNAGTALKRGYGIDYGCNRDIEPITLLKQNSWDGPRQDLVNELELFYHRFVEQFFYAQ